MTHLRERMEYENEDNFKHQENTHKAKVFLQNQLQVLGNGSGLHPQFGTS